jgi:hypothetical protein
MTMRKPSTARSVSIMAMCTALYAVFFFVSWSVTLPGFTLLYLPIVLLGVFPMWFGWKGLAGAMIGGFIGGAFVEGLGLLGVFEAVVALMIYMLNWVLIPRSAVEDKKKKSLLITLCVYSITLFVGTCYILLQYTVLPALFTTTEVWPIIATTYALNLPIVLILCPALIRAISPKLRTWGIYVGNFWEWRIKRNN